MWLRAVAQPWTGLKVKVTLGLFSAKDVTKVQDSGHPRFPFINLLSVIIPILPYSPEGFSIRLPFTPYLVDDRDEEEEDLVLPEWPAILTPRATWRT